MPDQPLLPFPPHGPGTLIPVNGDIALRDEGGVRVVFVRGVPFQRYVRKDRVAEALTVAMLAEAGAAKLSELEDAFGRDRTTIHRDRAKLREAGVAGLVPLKRGPKGPWKVREETEQAVRELRERKKVPVPAIAERLGLSKRSVYNILGLSREDRRPRGAQGLLSFDEPGATEPEKEECRRDASNEDAPPESATTACAEQAASQAQATCDRVVATTAGSTFVDPQVVPTPVEATTTTPPVSGVLPVPLSDGVAPDRSTDRGLACAGLIEEAPVELRPGSNLRFLGALVALPVLASLGLLDAFRETYGALRPAFYGLHATVHALFFMAILRVRRVEQLKQVAPTVLGRLLGLDRAPEVKTMRRKLAEMGKRSRAADLIRNLARRWSKLDEDAIGILYVDGHVRVYNGKRVLPKAHVAQLRLSMPATTDYWVNDREGDPLFLVTAPANRGMVAALPDIVKDIRSCVADRRVTIVFDRGGYSPALFKQLASDCDVLTYWKGNVEPLPIGQFKEEKLRIDGAVIRYSVAEREVVLAGGFHMRHVAVLRSDGKQTPILTTRRDWRAVYVAYRMFSRWRQENYFRYMSAEFALDALVDYATEPDDPDRLVPNPERRRIAELRDEAKARVADLERQYGRALEENEEARRPTARGVKIANGKTGRALRTARKKVDALHAQWRAAPERVPIGTLLRPEDVVKLDIDRRLVVDAVRNAGYRAESMLLASLTETSFARDQEEGRRFLQTVFRLSGDLDVATDGGLVVSLEPMSAPRFTRALSDLCALLTSTATCYPGTTTPLTYRVRGESVA